jgi:hypothetical protein
MNKIKEGDLCKLLTGIYFTMDNPTVTTSTKIFWAEKNRVILFLDQCPYTEVSTFLDVESGRRLYYKGDIIQYNLEVVHE